MNNKLLVYVIVPKLEMNFQIFVPINKRISDVIKLIEKALYEMTNGYYPKKDNSIIIDEESGNVYDINLTVKESRMINGSKLILI